MIRVTSARGIAAVVAVLLVAACGGNPAPEGGAGMPAANVGSDNVLTRAEIDALQAPTMEALFDGRFTGVQVIPRAGSFSLSIRGAGEPLLVLNGVPANDMRILSSLTPGSVERIQILKGPETAIYGLQGSNGVVVVTTRMQ